MKGSQFIGLTMILAGVALVYAGWKNVPVMSVIGLQSGVSKNPGSVSSPTTPIGVQNPVSGNPHNVRRVTSDTITEPATQPTHTVKRVGGM